MAAIQEFTQLSTQNLLGPMIEDIEVVPIKDVDPIHTQALKGKLH